MTCGPDPFSPVSADSISPLTGLSEPNQPGCAKPTPTAAPSSSSGFPACPSSPTSGSSTTPPAPSTCCTAATPASRSASPANAKARMIPDTCGPSSPDAFAFYDPASSSLKTSQGTLLSDSTESSPTLPKWGWMSGGALYERPTPGRLTGASGSSSLPTSISTGLNGTGRSRDETERRWRNGDYVSLIDRLALLPTPVANDDNKSAEAHLAKKVASGAGETITSLTVMSRQYAETGAWSNKLLPPPSASDHTGGEGATREARQRDGATGGASLRDIGHLLPTPMSATYQQGGDGGEFRAALVHGPTRRLLPTPTAQAAKHGAQTPSEAPGLRPQDDFNLWTAMQRLPGASTSPQSDDGNTSSDEPHPGQLTIEDA